MTDLPHTPAATLSRARRIALNEGLRHVYTGNVHDQDGGATRCAGCQAVLIRRDWYRILENRVTDTGACPDCGAALAGRFGPQEKPFGPRRILVAIQRQPA
jgi:pyruvate formate lyase activating enzyme